MSDTPSKFLDAIAAMDGIDLAWAADMLKRECESGFRKAYEQDVLESAGYVSLFDTHHGETPKTHDRSTRLARYRRIYEAACLLRSIEIEHSAQEIARAINAQHSAKPKRKKV